MTEPNDQVPTMVDKQSRIGDQPAPDPGPAREPSFENVSSSVGSDIPHIRFSADTGHPELSAPERTLIGWRRTASAGLTIDTSGPSSKNIRKESLEIRSLGPLDDDSATNYAEARAPPAMHHSSLPLTSPTSPRKRNRGYSLHRQLFFRNVQDRADVGVGIGRSSANDRGIELSSKDQATELKVEEADHDHPLRKSALPSVASSLPHYTLWARKQSYTLKSQIGLRCKNARNFLLRINEIPPSKEGRKIPVGTRGGPPLIDERTGKEYISNTIRSSRYTVWSFLPKQLFAQFSKLANL